jgi:hypothetical protein
MLPHILKVHISTDTPTNQVQTTFLSRWLVLVTQSVAKVRDRRVPADKSLNLVSCRAFCRLTGTQICVLLCGTLPPVISSVIMSTFSGRLTGHMLRSDGLRYSPLLVYVSNSCLIKNISVCWMKWSACNWTIH